MPVPPAVDRRLVSSDQLAEHLGLSRATVYALLNRGMPSLKVGRSRRFRLAEVDAWLDGEQNTSAP